MKKSSAFILLALMLSSFILVAGEEPSTDSNSTNSSLGKFEKSLNDRTENVLTREMPVPRILRAPTKLIFGVDETITWQRLIVVLILFSFAFMFVFGILELTAFQTTWVKSTISIVIMVVALVSGVVDKIASFAQGTVSNVFLFVAVFVMILIYVVERSVINEIKKQKKLAKAHTLGNKAGSMMKGLSETADTITKE